MPLIFLGALAATSFSILVHIDELIPNQEYFHFAVLDLLLTLLLSMFVTFMIFNLLENTMEEWSGVLREIETRIMAEPKRRPCFCGDQVIRRHLSARIFRIRLIRMKMGEFRSIESGFALEFLQQTIDNCITYVFMVNVGTKMWLL